MNVIVFTGPTLSHTEARKFLDATFLPPVSQGDVYRAALQQPQAIGIIDGYFHRVPAVWHKEILWAMSQGIRVFGSASMGALRAAELAPFGMEGAGWVFRAFRNGDLEDDDEVALIHTMIEIQGRYHALSEAMVNIRRTVTRAIDESVVSAATGAWIVAVAKSLFYGDRTYETILRIAAEAGLDPAGLEGFRDWLPLHRIDQKRTDAIEMLNMMQTSLSATGPHSPASFPFQRTELWNQLRSRLRPDPDQSPLADPEATASGEDRREALLRCALLECAERESIEVDAGILRQIILDFRRDRNLLESRHLDEWLDTNSLTLAQFVRWMEDEAKIHHVRAILGRESERFLPDVARFAAP